jgi:hypothetical protein
MRQPTCYNSLLYWFPKVEELGIPQPRSEIVWLGWERMCGLLDGKALPAKLSAEIETAALKIGFPLFMRTDLHSAKHDFAHTCYVPDAGALWSHVGALVEMDNLMCFLGDESQALVFREFLQLESTFVAFDGMPVARERRVFIKDGRLICSHPYWPKGALYRQKGLPADWRERLRDLSRLRYGDRGDIRHYASRVADYIPGAWSVDFAWVPQRQTWYLIDMAVAAQSWHPSCARWKLAAAENAGARQEMLL